jgi:2-keto-3-deoxy-L-rhamnonate aldolase RhmA
MEEIVMAIHTQGLLLAITGIDTVFTAPADWSANYGFFGQPKKLSWAPMLSVMNQAFTRMA